MTRAEVGAWARGLTRQARRPVRSLTTVAAPLAETARTLADQLPSAARLGPLRFRRRAWASNGRGLIELRRTDESADAGAKGRAVTAALRRLQGVRWAQVNAITGHVLVLFDDRAVNLGTLVETVTDVEEAGGDTAGGWSRAEPPHPADPAAVTAALLALTADVAGLAAAAATRMLLVPPVPTPARALIGIVEAQPRVRRLVEHAIGPAGADALVGVGSGVLNGLTGGVAPLVVTGMSHALLLGETRDRRAVWKRHEEQLRDAPGADPVHPPTKAVRPTAFPAGPIERLADAVAGASLVAAGAVLALTGSPARTADLLLVGVPPAARLGREAFAATLGRDLSRHGVVAMDPGALRRLDRITTVLIDQALLDDSLLPGLDGAGRPAPRPGAGTGTPGDLLAGLRGAGLTVAVASRRGGTTDGSGDEHTVSADEVRARQAAGEAVLVLASSDNDILAAADVALAVHRPGQPVGWAADLICAADATPALTVLAALPAARRLSHRGTALAVAGSAAAGLLTAFAPPPFAGDLTLQPVYLAAALAQLDGIRTARAAGRQPTRSSWSAMSR